ncbi:urease subunit beta [Embleya sp. AB8]|uniref:urease subunit beta n=1 Tax=Embleya sp. AB8 TaxID=3156304 RepID=UPI003C733278
MAMPRHADPAGPAPDRRTLTVVVRNTGDRTVRVGSHYHFFEVDPALSFARAATFGMRPNIPAGSTLRVAPGDAAEVDLCAFTGAGRMVGYRAVRTGRPTPPRPNDAGARAASPRTAAGRTLVAGPRPTTGPAPRKPGAGPPSKPSPAPRAPRPAPRRGAAGETRPGLPERGAPS